MSSLDRVVPTPALLEIDHIDLGLPLARAWEVLRHGDLGDSPLVHALFALRTIPDRLSGRRPGDVELRIDGLKSSISDPGWVRLHRGGDKS